MRILLMGGGGRESALAWKISQSARCTKLFIAPGNPGTAQYGENISLNILDFEAVGSFVLQTEIDMVIVGPEEPLVKGLADHFQLAGDLQHVLFVGPGSAGAKLEGSKAFAKQFMEKHGIPTAGYRTFTANDWEAARDFLLSAKPPFVLKADGLAAGKGVLIIENRNDAIAVLEKMLLGGMFGEASRQVVVEEFLDGREMSVFVLTDGEHYRLLPSAKDYKRIGEGDTGPNTGGMGAVSPVPFAGDELMEKVRQQIIEPTISGLKKEGIPYKGFIFFGLMVVGGDPFVIEYNVRLGDPETEVILPLLESDLVEALEACCHGTLSDHKVVVSSKHGVTVILTSGGYPEQYDKGMAISGMDLAAGDALVFPAGVAQKEGKMIASGGRVVAVTALAEDLVTARERAYLGAGKVHFDNMYYRRDIGLDVMK